MTEKISWFKSLTLSAILVFSLEYLFGVEKSFFDQISERPFILIILVFILVLYTIIIKFSYDSIEGNQLQKALTNSRLGLFSIVIFVVVFLDPFFTSVRSYFDSIHSPFASLMLILSIIGILATGISLIVLVLGTPILMILPFFALSKKLKINPLNSFLGFIGYALFWVLWYIFFQL